MKEEEKPMVYSSELPGASEIGPAAPKPFHFLFYTGILVFIILGTVLIIVMGLQTKGMRFNPKDPNSYANIDEFVTQNLEFNLSVNFQKQNKLNGTVIHTFISKNSEASLLILDSWDLEISDIVLIPAQKLTYNQISDENALIYGQRLEIDLEKTFPVGSTFQVKISYSTSPKAKGLNWLQPSQTSGGRYELLYSNAFPHYCRSIAPIQDTPAVKSTYKAKITILNPLQSNYIVRMSAKFTAQEPKGEYCTFEFEQRTPIPSYMIALVVGSLEKKPIGPKTNFFAESEIVSKYMEIFQSLETILTTVQKYFDYPYSLEEINFVILPRQYPFSGVQNPYLAFVDQDVKISNVYREVIHFWTGNLITTENYEHIWLIDAFTNFFFRKILNETQGDPDLYNLQSLLAKDYVFREYSSIGKKNRYSVLVPNLRKVSPDHIHIPFLGEKGFFFIYYLENLTSKPEFFLKFWKEYIAKYKSQSITSSEFQDFFKTFLYKECPNPDVIWEKIDWEYAFFKQGPLPWASSPDIMAANYWLCKNLSESYIKNGTGNTSVYPTLSTSAKQFFLSLLLYTDQALPAKTAAKLDEDYGLSKLIDKDISFLWFALGAKSKLSEQAFSSKLEEFLQTTGRLTYLEPVYQELVKSDYSKAKGYFDQYSVNYHWYAVNKIKSRCNF